VLLNTPDAIVRPFPGHPNTTNNQWRTAAIEAPAASANAAWRVHLVTDEYIIFGLTHGFKVGWQQRGGKRPTLK
jgi:hypothetical protein